MLVKDGQIEHLREQNALLIQRLFGRKLDIILMQVRVRVIKHIRKTYACKGCEAAPVSADKPAQLIEKSLASPSVLAMLLSTKYVDGIPLYRFERMLSRHGIDIPR